MERVTGSIFTLDLGVSAGYARGRPGDVPVSGSVVLKRSSESIDIAHSNLIAWLSEEFAAEKPARVVKERVMSLEAFKSMGMGQSVVYAHAGYHAIVAGLCVRFGIPWEDCPDSTARKHFIGKGRLGERQLTKDAVVQRCHVLNLMPRDCFNEDRADALAIHDWACATYGSKAASIANYQLFGQGAAP